MKAALGELSAIREGHNEAGKRLYALCGEKIFPCHALYLSVLSRSLELFEGFVLLAEGGKYGCCAALLRMQLDNVLRFWGVLRSKDQHATAQKIYEGKPLRNLKDRLGQKMTDGYLIRELSMKNPGINAVYKKACGFVHLSDEHVLHTIGRSTPGTGDLREFYISSEYPHVDEQSWSAMINDFKKITLAVFGLISEWEKLSREYDTTALIAKYAPHENA